MSPDDRPQCTGFTAPKPAHNGKPEVPSRRCRSKARTGRAYCAWHEPDEEFNAARKRQHEVAAQRVEQARRDQYAADYRAHQQLLERLSRVTLILDTNEHRCCAVGVLDWGFDRYDEGDAELVQCDSYLGHEAVTEHMSHKGVGHTVFWR